MTVNAEAAGVLQIVVPEGTTVAVGTVIATIGPAADAGASEGAAATERSAGNGRGPGAAPPAPAMSEPCPRRRLRPSARPAPGTATPLARRAALTTASHWASSTAPGRAAGSPAPTCWRPLASPQPPSQLRHSRAAALAQSLQPAVEELTRCPAADRPADDRGQSDDPPLPGADRGLPTRCCRCVRGCESWHGEATGALDQRPDRQGLRRSRCATIRAPTAPIATAAFELHPRVNVGFAVAADGALVVPDRLRRRCRSRSERSPPRPAASPNASAAGEITPAELSGATFTVSNLGMYGMTAITPGDQPAAGRDPRRRRDPRASRPGRRRDRRPLADDAHAQLRPPDPLRRRRRASSSPMSGRCSSCRSGCCCSRPRRPVDRLTRRLARRNIDWPV